MNLVTLDFETYFGDDYTLSKMTTEAYVRDPRFKTHCVGLKGTGAATSHGDAVLRNLPSWEFKDKAILCHHTHFDGLILAHHYGIKPAFWFDTLSMARLLLPHLRSHSLGALAKYFGLQEKSVPYQLFKGKRDLEPELQRQLEAGCANDVEITYEIFKRLLPYVPKEELRIIDLTIRMFTEPALRLDRQILDVYLSETRNGKRDLLAACGVTDKDCASADKFAALLQAQGVTPPVKVSKTTGEIIYAFAKTDPGMRELQEHENENVAALAAARLGVKSTIGETRAQRMLDMDTRGAMCVYLKYCGAHTTRWSGGDKMNWQNFTRGSVLRSAVLAPPGCVVCVADSSQIECRLLNWQAKQWDVLQAFAEGRDIYSELATKFYGRPITKADKPERGVGKQLELSCGYGAGTDTIIVTARNGTYGPPVHLTEDQGRMARDLYRQTHPRVKELWEYANEVIIQLHSGATSFQWGALRIHGKQIFLPNGTYLDYSHLIFDPMAKSFQKWNSKMDGYFVETRKGRTRLYGALLVENVIQALARVVLSQAMLQIAPRYKIVTCTHDEIVYLAPEAEAQAALDFGLQVMKTPPAWCAGIPLDAEGGYDRRYSK